MALAILIAATGAVSALAGPPLREHGQPAHGQLTVRRGERIGSEWLVFVRSGRVGAVVQRGEGFAAQEVSPTGVFKLKLEPGTYTLGASDRHLHFDPYVERLCGLTTVTVRAHKPIPTIHVRCP
jgi:hypothetical protein